MRLTPAAAALTVAATLAAPAALVHADPAPAPLPPPAPAIAPHLPNVFASDPIPGDHRHADVSPSTPAP